MANVIQPFGLRLIHIKNQLRLVFLCPAQNNLPYISKA
nr:MAG TPA_asm: hypothetical protein [Bacteriophage sp.]